MKKIYENITTVEQEQHASSQNIIRELNIHDP